MIVAVKVFPVDEILRKKAKLRRVDFDRRALIDTGATMTCISNHTIKSLALQPVRFVDAETTQGTVETAVYGIHLEVLGADDVVRLEFVEAMAFTHPATDRYDMLLGMNVITQSDFRIDKNGRFSMRF